MTENLPIVADARQVAAKTGNSSSLIGRGLTSIQNGVYSLPVVERENDAGSILKQNLGQLNSNLDPEVMQAGMELAAFHIEAGARTFSEMAKAITSDLGVPETAIKKYLRSWYNGGRVLLEEAGHDVSDMDSPESASASIYAFKPPEEGSSSEGNRLTPEEESKFLPIMGEIFCISAKMGYVQFKDAARYVMTEFRKFAGDDVADKVSLNNLQACYINTASRFGRDKRGAMAFDTLEDLLADTKAEIDAAAHESASAQLNDLLAPTKTQAEAGNHKQGHLECFNEVTYAQVKPYLQEAFVDLKLAATDMSELFFGLVRGLAEYGLDRSVIEKMRPHLKQFVRETLSGKESIAEAAPSPPNDLQAPTKAQVEAENHAPPLNHFHEGTCAQTDSYFQMAIDDLKLAGADAKELRRLKTLELKSRMSKLTKEQRQQVKQIAKMELHRRKLMRELKALTEK
jgi:hypothetical protein